MEEAFPNVLDARLASARFQGRRVEVVNAGVPGYNTLQERLLLEEKGLGLAPDLVAVSFFLNDAIPWSAPGPEARGLKQWIKDRFGLYWLAVRLRDRRRFHEEGFETEITPLVRAARGEPAPGWAVCAAELGRIGALARGAGADALLVLWPALDGLAGNYPYAAEHALVAATARDAGFEILDLLAVFRGTPEADIRVSPSDGHPNARGHAAAAAALEPWIRRWAEARGE